MTIVKAPLDYYPNACIATGRDDGELIDTGQDFEPNPIFDRVHIYLSKGWVMEQAREQGMASENEVLELKRRLDEMKAQLARFEQLGEAVEAMEKEPA